MPAIGGRIEKNGGEGRSMVWREGRGLENEGKTGEKEREREKGCGHQLLSLR
jgi:hypothetical protein